MHSKSIGVPSSSVDRYITGTGASVIYVIVVRGTVTVMLGGLVVEVKPSVLVKILVEEVVETMVMVGTGSLDAKPERVKQMHFENT